MDGKRWLLIAGASAVVTVGFYFILRALNNAQLLLSTLSVATSMMAACLTFFRSPYHALGYAVNDLVLIVLWILAVWTDISSLSMVICFIVFLVADLYGFYSWRRMQRRQEQTE
jgi:nicotinamide mononucleotide transporter PnuC